MDGIKDAATVEFYKEAKPLKIESPLIFHEHCGPVLNLRLDSFIIL